MVNSKLSRIDELRIGLATMYTMYKAWGVVIANAEKELKDLEEQREDAKL